MKLKKMVPGRVRTRRTAVPTITPKEEENFKKYKLFLDSGAHTFFHEAKKLGRSFIKDPKFRSYLNSYIAFLHQYKDVLEAYVNLDIIQDAESTWIIQKELEANGLKPLPVFHYPEDLKYLKRYIDKYEYIGIGGIGQELTVEQYIPWADSVFRDYICHPDGTPRVKVHGFGLATYRLITRYPWFSVDSATWCKFGFYGILLFPEFDALDGELKYIEIGISSKSPRQERLRQHYDNLPRYDQKLIKKFCEDSGFNLSVLAVSYKERCRFNAFYYNMFNASHSKLPKKFRYGGVRGFDSAYTVVPQHLADKRLDTKVFNIYLAGMTTGVDYEVELYNTGVRHRLYSYFYIGENDRCEFRRAAADAFRLIAESKLNLK